MEATIRQAFQKLSHSHANTLKCPETINEQSIDEFAFHFFEQRSQDLSTQTDLTTLLELRQALEAMPSTEKSEKTALERKIESMILRLKECLDHSSISKKEAASTLFDRPLQEDTLTYLDLPHDLHGVIYNLSLVTDLGRIAAVNTTRPSLVQDFLLTSFQQALESTSLKDSVDPFIETLRSVVKADQTFDERSQAINHIMKELSIALHLFPDMKAVELAPFISQLYVLASSHKMTLTEYLTYLKKIKSLNWPYEGLHAFMDDELVAKLSVRKDMRAIGFVDSNHQSYREIIKFALRYNGRALQKLDLSLRNDPEIVRLAIEQDPLAIFYASPELQSNKELAKLAIAKHELSLGLIKVFSDDFEMVTFAVRHHGKALDGASPRLQNCREIVELAILQNREAFAYASPELQKDPQLRALAKLPPKKKQSKVERFFSKIASLFTGSSRQA